MNEACWIWFAPSHYPRAQRRTEEAYDCTANDIARVRHADVDAGNCEDTSEQEGEQAEPTTKEPNTQSERESDYCWIARERWIGRLVEEQVHALYVKWARSREKGVQHGRSKVGEEDAS